MRYLIAILLAGAATPAYAQQHQGHAMPKPAPAGQDREDCEAEAERHRAMGHAVPEGACEPAGQETQDPSGMDHSTMDHTRMGHSGMDHLAMGHDEEMSAEQTEGPTDHAATDHSAMQRGSMDHSREDHDHSREDHDMDASAQQTEHSAMDHGTMDHGAMDHSAMGHSGRTPAIPSGPPPASAGSGPANAADAYWGTKAMDEARARLRHEQGGQRYFWFQGDRVEYRARENADSYLFDLQGYYGGDLDKFWFKSEGEGSFGEEIEGVEVQALYSRAIAPFFDLQVGIRQDFAPMDRTYAVVGVQGLAPYLFEVDAAAFLSDRGDLTARVEAELDQRITQRLVVQPRVEASFSAQDVPELGIGAGLDSIEAGVRLRYHFAREFAPYIGIDQEWRIGGSADYARAEGEDPSVTNYVVGVRFWF